MALVIDYIPSKTFEEIDADTSRSIFVMGPFNSGKSTGCIFKALRHALAQNPGPDGVRRWKHVVVRKTKTSLELTTIRTWQKWFKGALKMKWHPNIIGKIEFPLSDGTRIDMEIVFLGIEDPKALSRLKSLDASSIHINEADELTLEMFETAKGRIDRYPAKDEGGTKNPFVILDYNGVSTQHWLYDLAEVQKPKGYSFYRQPPAVLRHRDEITGKCTYTINPDAENLDNAHDYYVELLNSSEDFITVNLMNQYGEVRSGKPVYKDYDESEHIVSLESPEERFRPSPNIPVVIGMDLGLTPAAAFTQRLWDGTVVVFDEIVTEDCSIEEFVHKYLFPTISEHKCGSNYHVVIDPAGKQRSQYDKRNSVQMLRELGVQNVSTARSNDPVRRINSVTNCLRKSGKFKLYTDCKVLRKGFLADYKYGSSNLINGIVKYAKPEKNLYSHVHDALQYAMLEYDPGYTRSYNAPNWLTTTRRKYRPANSIGGY